jgi:uncharacterized protein YajQ (UPF0234 family)
LHINWQSETTKKKNESHFNWYAMHQVLQEDLGKKNISGKIVSVSQQRSTVSQTVKTSLWPGDYPPTYSPDLVTYDFVLP